MKYSNGDKVSIHSTSCTSLDGKFAEVVGVATYFGDGMGSIYILRIHNNFIKGWETFTLTESCFNSVVE